jgi:hypothetical protein
MKLQRRFAPTGGEFTPESVARFIGICKWESSLYWFSLHLQLTLIIFLDTILTTTYRGRQCQ